MKERIKRFLHYLYISIKRPEMAVLPGNLAFFFMMMMIPLLTILGIVISRLDVGKASVYEALITSFPKNIASLIISISGESSDAIGIGALLLTSFFLATNGTYSMITTANSIYGIKNSSYIKDKIKSVILLLALIILFIVLLIIPTINTKVLKFIETLTHTNAATNIYFWLYKFLRYPVTFLLVFIFVKILYKFSPSKAINKRTNYGAIFSSIIMVIVTWGYSFYIEYFNTYETFYGGISSLLFLMLYLYIISYVFVLGININYAREKMIEEKGKI